MRGLPYNFKQMYVFSLLHTPSPGCRCYIISVRGANPLSLSVTAHDLRCLGRLRGRLLAECVTVGPNLGEDPPRRRLVTLDPVATVTIVLAGRERSRRGDLPVAIPAAEPGDDGATCPKDGKEVTDAPIDVLNDARARERATVLRVRRVEQAQVGVRLPFWRAA